MITSRRNARLKELRRLLRCKGDRAVLEGPHLIAEALATGTELETVLVTPEFGLGAAARKLLPTLPQPPLEVDPGLLDEVTDSDSPRGIVAVARLPRGAAAELPVTAGGIYLYLESLQDPGNLGALARVAEAAGCEAIALGPGSVHPNHPRALRASAGSLLRLPVAVRTSPDELDVRLATVAPTWIALTPHGGRDLYREDFPGTQVIALGSEGAGLSPALSERTDVAVTIPLQPGVESLNVTVAAAVVLFELRRRRS
ncbi:MAG: RNA methyltransferase [Thermoanaerobaculia bacterium]